MPFEPPPQLLQGLLQVLNCNLQAFLATHPVFRLDEFAQARSAPQLLTAARNQLKHHLRRGRVKRVARSVYAAVPFGHSAAAYQPDPLLVALAIRPEGIFSHHTALELLGAGHSVWQATTLWCDRPAPTCALGSHQLRFLDHPTALRRKGRTELGLRQGERQGRRMRFAGPERTLAEGLRQPRWVGGLEELLAGVSGFAVLDLGLLDDVLAAYGQHLVWAAVGWILERERERLDVPDQYLTHQEGDRGLGRARLAQPRGGQHRLFRFRGSY